MKDQEQRKIPFLPPYYFIVGRCMKWNKEDPKSWEVLYIVSEPTQAYQVYIAECEKSQKKSQDALWEWFLHDSFHKGAVDFCKEKYDNLYNLSRPVSVG